jgi:uncharacterized protein (DUF1501 family)
MPSHQARHARDGRRGPRRRELLVGLAAGLVSLLRPRGVRGQARAEVRTATPPPRYWIHVVMTGGLDAVWTTDPKTLADVKAGVDVPYRPDQILTAGDLRLGPLFEPLLPVANRLTIVNGVLVRTANHYTGIEQCARLRTMTTMRTPAAFDIIGAHRDSQALASVTLNASLRQAHTAGFFGTSAEGDFGGGASVLAEIDSLDAEARHELARVLGDRARALQRLGSPTPARAVAIDNMQQVAAFLARTAELPAFELTPWLEGPFKGQDDVGGFVSDLQRAVWLIEHDLAATLTVFAGNFFWDSHYRNSISQSAITPVFAAALERFFHALSSRSNRHGALDSQTGVILTTELGRMPYLNAFNGKDHFPQSPVIVAAPGLVAGRQFGGTGKEMEALPISTRTGRVVTSGERLVLDDLGHTVLRRAGIDPARYGFPGRELAFLAKDAL